jgi:Ca2+-binding RTX toxin-like protein
MATFTGTSLADRLTGTVGADTLNGMAGNDILVGRGGNDILDGGAGNDRMNGGAGDDVYYVDSTGDVINEVAGVGTDTVHATVSYTLAANVENGILDGSASINLTGNGSNNLLTGNAGSNTLSGGAGNDSISGGGGGDTLSGGTGNDTLSGGTGNDTFLFAAGDGQDIITDFATGDIVRIASYGSAQSVTRVGGNVVLALSTADKITFDNATLSSVQAALQFGAGSGGVTVGGTITGTNGGDVLNGTAGNDRIIGGAGADTLTGGLGSDTFVYTSVSDSPYGAYGSGADWITDYYPEDRFDLSGIDANANIAGNQAFQFAGYSWAHPPTVTTPGTLTIGGFGGEVWIIGFTDSNPGPDLLINLWSPMGERALTVDHIFL